MAKVKPGRAAAAWRTYREVSRPGSPGLGSRIKTVPRMLRAAMRGDYPALTRGKMAMLGAAVVYIISPIDAIPDFLLGIGVVDDFGVFLWLTAALLGESGRYVEWEQDRQGPLRNPGRGQKLD